jgi:hypothetical protein
MNYDRQLLSMSQEVQHWERLRMAVPYIAMEIQAQREKYRVLRDNMLMLAHDYNKVTLNYACCAATPWPALHVNGFHHTCVCVFWTRDFVLVSTSVPCLCVAVLRC